MKLRTSHLLFLWTPLLVASLFLARPALGETILLKNATVHTVSGQVLSPGDVLIENGKILAVGQAAQKADHVVDLKGQHLYPGLIALNTALGLVEIAAVRASSDEADVGQFIPDVRSWIAVNPDSELIPVARANGVTIVEPTPEGGGLVAGQSGLIALDGWTSEKMAFKTPDALHVYWPDMNISATGRRGGGGGVGGRGRGGRGGGGNLDEQDRERLLRIKELDDYFTDARAYDQARQAAKDKGAPDPGLNPSWEAMLPYVRGQLPIMVHAEDARQIKAALKWAAANQCKIIIAGGRDAWMAADLLAKAGVPVIYDNVYTMPARDFKPSRHPVQGAGNPAPSRREGGHQHRRGREGTLRRSIRGEKPPLCRGHGCGLWLAGGRSAQRHHPLSGPNHGCGRPPRFHRGGQGRHPVCLRWRHSGPSRQRQARLDRRP